ncbi:MAG: hypothetical protein ACM3X1_05315 [Ignavibacteriales bacterium]
MESDIYYINTFALGLEKDSIEMRWDVLGWDIEQHPDTVPSKSNYSN